MSSVKGVMLVFEPMLASSLLGSRPRIDVRLFSPRGNITRGLYPTLSEVSNHLGLNLCRNAFRKQGGTDSTTMFGGTS